MVMPTLDAAELSSPALIARDDSDIELSVVMPCLNEKDTLAICVEKALTALKTRGIRGEVIVADNGSTDGSQEIARTLGARVVQVPDRGYGNALRGGIAAARGKWVLMGDADDSYDFRVIGDFYDKLQEGHDIVQGCRLPRGGGTVMPGAMPPSHRWLGNPMFTRMANMWFNVPVSDVYCGMRAFRREFYNNLDLRCTGMEFATEMLIKSSLFKGNIAEIPITLHRDGRVAHAPHLRTFRDGWRTLRFFLLYSPRWLFFTPGLLLMLLGVIGYGVVLSHTVIGKLHFDAHSLLFASLFIIMGYQAVLFAVSAWTFATAEGLMPMTKNLKGWFGLIDLEKGLIAGVLSMVFGLVLLGHAVLDWRSVGFGELDYSHTMRWVIPGVTLMAVGFQTVLSSFFLSVLGMQRPARGIMRTAHE
ncbi:MAG: glycosyltransferase family 2 protein [bacterium]